MIVIVEFGDEFVKGSGLRWGLLVIFLVFIEIGGVCVFLGWFIVGDVLVVVAVDAVFSVLVRKGVPY